MDDPKRQILDIFGVTEEQVTAYDEAIGGPKARERERHFREEVMPARIAEVRARFNTLLDEMYPGLRIELGQRELTHEEQLKLDILLYGRAYERRHEDGRRERIPPPEVTLHIQPED